MKEQLLKFAFLISFITVVTLTFLIIKNNGSLTSSILISSKSSVNEPNQTTLSNNIDICRCLTEPGNSNYMLENGKACDKAISIAIGVEDWGKVNMSQNPIISQRFDALTNNCR